MGEKSRNNEREPSRPCSYLPDARINHTVASKCSTTGCTKRRIRRLLARRLCRAARKQKSSRNTSEMIMNICRGSRTYTIQSSRPVGRIHYCLPRHRKDRAAPAFVIPENVKTLDHRQKRFQVGAMDTGAQLSVMGVPQARAFAIRGWALHVTQENTCCCALQKV